jgi:TrpR-related protein YerC/YecD
MKRRFSEDTWRSDPAFRGLVAAIRALRSDDDLASFLRDVGTLSELRAWSERLEVARLLTRGYSYRQVARLTGASTTTVTRVAQFLEGGRGGYRKVLEATVGDTPKPGPVVAATLREIGAPRGEGKRDPTDHRRPGGASLLQKYLEKNAGKGS